MILHNNKSQKYFIVEGNIGAGKSTFLKRIAEYLDVQIVYEPHEHWQTVGGQDNLLQKFYADTKRWAYTFQSYAFVTRIMAQEEYAKRNPHQAQVLERSVFSDRYCFAKNCYESGLMTSLEWKLYQEWFEWLVDNYTAKPTGFIYLKTAPEVCYDRLRKRNRHEEVSVSLEYIQQLHDKHESWLMRKEGIASYLQDVPVLALQCDNDFEHDRAELEAHVQKMAAFFQLHGCNIIPAIKQQSFSEASTL